MAAGIGSEAAGPAARMALAAAAAAAAAARTTGASAASAGRGREAAAAPTAATLARASRPTAATKTTTSSIRSIRARPAASRRRRLASPLLLLPLLALLLLSPSALLLPAAAADDAQQPASQQQQQATPSSNPSAASGGKPQQSQQQLQPQQQQPRYPNPDAPALKFAVINQVQFHLEVVAGAMHVLRGLTSLDVHVYLPAKVLAQNWYGFASWMRGAPGVVWRQLKEYDGREQYDLAWFLSPEYHIPYVEQVVAAMKPKVTLLYVHNAHMPEADFARLKKLQSAAGGGAGIPFVTLAPHVARYIQNRTAGTESAVDPVWVLPVYPYHATKPCGMQDLLDARKPGGTAPCLRGFSVQGRIESSRRNYSEVWHQIAEYRREHGQRSLSSFRLNILGEAVEKFFVPPDVRDVVAVYKNPPYPVFYDVVAHSLALVPMLASPLYYESKFSSTVYSSMITGVPMIADDKFLDAYTMIDRSAVYHRGEGQEEVDVMFRVSAQDARETWRARQAVSDLRDKLNKRASGLLRQWLDERGAAR